nr:MAG TPA_asm: tail tape measure [Caudoviricetes sp.]
MPDTSKLAGGIKKSLAGLDAEGKTAGKKLGSGMSQGMKGQGKGAGDALGKEIIGAMERSVKGGTTKVGKIVDSDAGKAGKQAAESFGRELDSKIGDEAESAGKKAGARLSDSISGLKFGAVAGAAAGLASSLVGSFGDIMRGAAEASDATDKFKQTLNFAGLDTSAIEQATAAAQKYADQTVYDLGDIQNMTAQLAANGIKDYTGLAEAAGNLNAVAGGNAETFKSVGMVMTQTAGAGKLTTENWNQLSDAVPGASGKIQQALLEAGAYTGNFRDAMADGEITAEEFNDAVMKLGSEPIAQEAAKSTATFEGMLGNLKATVEGELAKAFNELKPIIGSVIDGLANAAGTVLPVFVGAVKAVAGALNFLGEHKGPVLGVVGALGALTAGIVAYNAVASIQAAGGFVGVMAKMKTAIMETTVAQTLLNTAMWTSPITWIVAGIAAVVGALALFFTKTETGRALWSSFTQAIGAGWDWIVGKFQAGISWISSTFGPVFSQIGDTISGAWDATVEKVSGAIARVKEIISGALTFWQTGETTDFAAALGISEDSPLFTAMTFLRDKLVEVKDFAIEAWTLMQEKWAEFTTGFGQFYQTWIQPVVDAFGTAFSAIVPVVTAAWDMLGSAVFTVWNGVIKPVFDAFMQVASVVFPAIAGIVGTVVGAAFRIMGDVISTVWNGVIRPAWEVMRTVFGIVADVLTGNFSNLGNRFSELGQRIRALVVGVFTAAFNILRSVVTNSLNAAKAVINIFKQAVINMVNAARERINSLVAGFQAMPGRIKAAFAGAGSWLLDAGRSIISGLAQGVRNAAGMVEDAVRAVIPDNLERFVPGLYLGGVVPAFARGGVLPSVPGYTRNDRDPILGWSKEKKQPIARVEPGEFIVNRDATKKYGRLLAAINGGKFDGTKGDFGLPGYAKGGVVGFRDVLKFLRGGSVNGQKASGSLEGWTYENYPADPNAWGDCSYTSGKVAALTTGENTSGRKYATMSQGQWLAAHDFKRGRGPGKDALETAYFNGGPWGGHTASTIFDSAGKALNFEMGGGRGNGQIGGPAAGSRHSQFTDVWWHPLKSAAGQALADGKIVGTSTKGVTVDAGEGNKFQAETIDWGEASKYGTDWEKENKRNKNLRRWSAGIFDTGGILKPGNFAFNASGKPERVLDPRLTVAVEKVAETSPALAKSMDNLAKVNWDNVGAQVSEGWAKRMDGYQSFAGAQARSIQRGDKMGAYLSNVGLSEGLGLADQIGSLVGIDGIKSTFGGVVGAFEDMEDAAVAEVDASDAVKQAEKNLAKARKEGSPEDVQKAEEELTKARGAVQLAARATGQAQIAMMVELASLAINLIKGIFKFVEGKIQDVMQAHVSAFKAVGSAMESVGKLDAEVLKLRESVTGLVIDQAMAQIELAAAARNVRIAQMDGVTSQLQATKTLAEAQAAFDEQRQADMRLAAMGYDDLSLAYDRFRWGMLDANGDVMDQMAAWSDESHALYSELLAAQVNQQLVEKQAQQANLEAAYKHTLAVIELNDVTSSLEVAAKKLAVASGHAFGMDQVGATVGQRYAELMGEKASLQADQASLKTWLNPVNWFTTMPANQRRIKQIDQQLAQLQAMPEFKNVDQSALAEMDKAVKASGWMGFFGAGDKVDEMIKNSALGDASRALDQMEFENRLIDLKAEQDSLRRKVEKNLAEVEYRKQLDPLETLIAGLEQERDSNKTWAEYWRTDNENIRKALADLAGHQADYAGELKRMSAEPNKVVQISGDTFSREQLEAAMAELGVRVERLERPRASASQVVASRR